MNEPIAFHPTQDPINSVGVTHTLGTGTTQGCCTVAVAFSAKDYGADVSEEISPTLRAMPHDGSHANGGGQVAVAFQTRGSNVDVGAVSGTIVTNPIPFDTTQITSPGNFSRPREGDSSLLLAAGAHPPALATTMQVRRLTPRECERLQGFPDDYTLIPVKRVSAARLSSPKEQRYVERDGQVWQLAADGPRYKALGNSMAVPVMRWIGERIQRELDGELP